MAHKPFRVAGSDNLRRSSVVCVERSASSMSINRRIASFVAAAKALLRWTRFANDRSQVKLQWLVGERVQADAVLASTDTL